MIRNDIMEKALEIYDWGESDFIGFCLACGAEQSGVEPDAEKYTCNECKKPEVYGIEQIILMG